MISAAIFASLALRPPAPQEAFDTVERITESAWAAADHLDARGGLLGPFAVRGDRALVADWILRGPSRVLELRLGDDAIEVVDELRQDGPKVGVGRHQDTVLVRGALEDDLIGLRLNAELPHVHGLVPRRDQVSSDKRGQRVVDQESHSARRKGSSRSRTASDA